MNKKVILIIIIVITLFLFLLIFQRNYKYNKLILESEITQEIMSTRIRTTNLLIDNLYFDGYKLIYDDNTYTYYYSMIDDSPTRYNPDVKYSGKNVKIVMEKEITDEIIENNEKIYILIYNDTEYNLCTLTCTTLPILNINCTEFDDINDEENTDMSIWLFDNSKGATNRVTESDGKIHIRGGITAILDKKSYKISLRKESIGNNTRNNDISLLGMRQDDDWILYAGYNDQEKIRNVFSMNLWYESCSNNNSFDIENGVQYKYVEVFVNNKYYGLYALGYPVDENVLNVDEDEYMFKKIDFNEVEINIKEDENNKLDGYELVNDVKNEDTAWNTLNDYYKTLLNSQSTDELYAVSDIKNVVDYFLFQLFVQGNDNTDEVYLKNVFITFKNLNNMKVALYTPWDYDMSFGNIYDEFAPNATNEYKIESSQNRIFKLNAIYYLQELGDENITNLIKTRYKNLRETYWSNEHLNELIESYTDDIYNSGAFAREKEKWLNGSYNEDGEKLTKFKEFLFERVQYTDEYVNGI